MKTLNSALKMAALLCLCSHIAAQEPSALPPATDPASQGSTKPPSTDQGSSSNKTKNKEIPSFLIIGTVFNENAISFPGVQVKIRRAEEKKFRWETYTNSRGEFAVRVPPGYDYELLVHVKKYKDQNQSVSSKADVQQRLSIRLEAQDQTKAGAKP
jgi:hypothetical protein